MVEGGRLSLEGEIMARIRTVGRKRREKRRGRAEQREEETLLFPS